MRFITMMSIVAAVVASTLQAQQQPRVTTRTAAVLPTLDVHPINKEELDALPLSGASYFMYLRYLTDLATLPVSTITSEESASSREATGFARLRPATMETTVAEVNATADTNQDVEPTVVGVNRVGGTEEVVTAYMKYVSTGLDEFGRTRYGTRIHITRTTDFSTFTPRNLQMGVPPNRTVSPAFTQTADSVLAANTTTTGPGVYRIYCGGLAVSEPGAGQTSAYSLWTSDDGGSTWTAGKTIFETARVVGNDRYYDKPAIAVSTSTVPFDGHGATAGQVYIAWVDVDMSSTDQSTHRIMFSRSVDGGDTFSTPQQLAQGYVGEPQIVVPYNTGRVFVLWASYTYRATRINQINMTRSTDQGQTFSALASLANTRMFGPDDDATGPDTDNLPNGVKARTTFIAHYNPNIGIEVIYHGEQPNDTTHTDIYHAYFDGQPATGPVWKGPFDVTLNTPGDQYCPGFTVDDTTQRVAYVTYYSSQEDTAAIPDLYYEYYAKVNNDSTVSFSGRLSNVQSSPGNYQGGALHRDEEPRFLGDYQDLWFGSFRRIVSAWIGVPAPRAGNVYLSRIQLP